MWTSIHTPRSSFDVGHSAIVSSLNPLKLLGFGCACMYEEMKHICTLHWNSPTEHITHRMLLWMIYFLWKNKIKAICNQGRTFPVKLNRMPLTQNHGIESKAEKNANLVTWSCFKQAIFKIWSNLFCFQHSINTRLVDCEDFESQ